MSELLLHPLQFLLVLFLLFRFQCWVVFATHLELGPLNSDFVSTNIVIVQHVERQLNRLHLWPRERERLEENICVVFSINLCI